jgi:hypothetical protein
MNFNFVYTPQEMFAIGIVIAIIEIIKSRVPKNLHRYLALPIAAILAVCIVIEAAGGWPGWAMLAAQGIQITLKIAFAAMGLFDLVLKKKTTTQAGEKQEKEEGVM